MSYSVHDRTLDKELSGPSSTAPRLGNNALEEFTNVEKKFKTKKKKRIFEACF